MNDKWLESGKIMEKRVIIAKGIATANQGKRLLLVCDSSFIRPVTSPSLLPL